MDTHRQIIDYHLAAVNDKEWGLRHYKAWYYPNCKTERTLGELIKASAEYADEYWRQYGCKIGDDGVLGVHWARIVRNIIGLLDGDCGRLDRGTLCSTLRDMLALEGFGGTKK